MSENALRAYSCSRSEGSGNMKGTSSADNTWPSRGKVRGRCKRDASYCSKVRSKVNTEG